MRLKSVSAAEFKALLTHKRIRGASLQDVEGLHHGRSLYRHPSTSQLFVAVSS